MIEPSYSCRICRSPEHELVLDFGDVVLADGFLDSVDQIADEVRFPLTLVICKECLHLQIKEVLDPKLLFSEYVWETGIPASIHQYCRDFADSVIERIDAAARPTVVEIASNDGTMLKEFRSRGFDVVGVDPAQNIAHKANAAGIPTVADFFGERVAAEVESTYGKRDLVLARNVLAHVADLHGLVAGVKRLLKEDGVAVIEVPHLLTMFQELQYDQVFHEHVGYHSLDSMVKLFAMHGLEIFDAECTWIHGGSVRAYFTHASSVRETSSSVARILGEEAAAGLLSLEGWRKFGERALNQKRLLREALVSLRDSGKLVVGYGASAKGQSMIQFCELGNDLVRYVVDKSPMKIGKITPGSHIPIVAPDRMRSDPVDVVLVFAWNFAQEILEQESEMRDRGVQFLHPIPEPHYI